MALADEISTDTRSTRRDLGRSSAREARDYRHARAVGIEGAQSLRGSDRRKNHLGSAKFDPRLSNSLKSSGERHDGQRDFGEARYHVLIQEPA